MSLPRESSPAGRDSTQISQLSAFYITNYRHPSRSARPLATAARFTGTVLRGLALLALFCQPIAASATRVELPDIGLANDPAPASVTGQFRPGSHVKLFLPNLPYLAISHAVNASLVRPAENEQGWQLGLPFQPCFSR